MQRSSLLIIVQQALALENVFGLVFMVAIRLVRGLVVRVAWAVVKNHACIIVRVHAEADVGMVVSHRVQEIAAVPVLVLRFNHVKTVPALVHPHAKAVVVRLVQQVVNHLVKMVAKALVDLHVQVVVILGAARAAIMDVRELATVVALVLVIQVVKRPVKVVVKELVKGIVLVHVLDRAKIHVKELVTVVVILLAWELVKACVCTVAVGVVQAISIIRILLA